MADPRVEALHSSVSRLHHLAAPMSEDQLTLPAYPSEWSIADVLSHIGSGAAIMHRRLDDTLAGRDTPDDFAPGVWDTWNAKTGIAKRDDALHADAALLARIQDVTPAQSKAFSMAMGPMTLTFDEFAGMRLNEHALHTWDIEVSLDPAATLPPQIAAQVIDNLDLIARYTAKPTGDTTVITVTTTDPTRGFTVDLTPEAVTLSPRVPATTADVEITAEAFARLIYGRLDPEHTPPPDHHGPALDMLRNVFPGP